MLKNYLLIAIRNLMKQKTFMFINVFGLAVGVACCMIFGLYLHFLELPPDLCITK